MKTIKSTSLVNVPNMARLLHRCVATNDRNGVKLCKSALFLVGLSEDDMSLVAMGNFKVDGDSIVIRSFEGLGDEQKGCA